MNNFTKRIWYLPVINEDVQALMKTCIDYPPRKVRSETWFGPIALARCRQFRVQQRGVHTAGSGE